MKFKVGDKVMIRQGMQAFEDVDYRGVYFNSDMQESCEKRRILFICASYKDEDDEDYNEDNDYDYECDDGFQYLEEWLIHASLFEED